MRPRTYPMKFVWRLAAFGVFLMHAAVSYGQPNRSSLAPKPLAALSLSITTTNATCDNKIQPWSYSRLGDGSITATASGGVPPYTYYLSPVGTTQNNGYFPGMAGGNYEVYVTDAAGTTIFQSTFVTNTFQQPVLGINILQVPSSCTSADGSLQLVGAYGTPPYTFSSDGGVTFTATNTFTGLQQGFDLLYLLKDANGCLAESVTSGGSNFQAQNFMCNFCCNYVIQGLWDSAVCGNTAKLTVYAQYATPPVSFSLDGVNFQVANGYNQYVDTFYNLGPGIYHVYAKTTDGSITQATFTMPKACSTILGFQTLTPSCNGSDGSITVIATYGTSPYTYSMDGVNFQTSNIFSGLSAGGYGITVKDAAGIMESGTATLINICPPAVGVVTASVSAACGNPNGEITVTASKGVPPYQYSIDGVNYTANNIFTGLAPGAYTLWVKDVNGLMGSSQATVANVAGPLISAISSPPFCANANGMITISAIGGAGPLSFSVDDGVSFQSSNQFTVVAPGQYDLIVKDANGCMDTATQPVTVIPAPTVMLGNDTSICIGDSLDLQAPLSPGDQYLWQDNSTAGNYRVYGAGAYSVKVTNSSNCVARDTIRIMTEPLPVFSLGRDTVVCTGKIILLAAPSFPGTYLWSDGSNAASLKVNAAGLYWLQVNESGCRFRDSIQVNYKPAPSIRLGDDSTLCTGQILLLDVTNVNASYSWQDGSTSPLYKVDHAGKYTVSVSIDGCDTSGSIRISYITLPVPAIPADTTLCISQDWSINAFYPQSSYIWQDGSTDPQFKVTHAGTYSVQVTNTCGTTIDSTVVKIDECNCKFYVPGAFTPNGDGKNDVFKPKWSCLYSNYELRIFNRYGQVVFESKDPDEGWDGNLANKAQPVGGYVWIMHYQDRLTGKAYEQKGEVILIR
jgi:gliding motility-associated-like protein